MIDKTKTYFYYLLLLFLIFSSSQRHSKLGCCFLMLFVNELLTLLEKNQFISVHYTTIYWELECLNISWKKLQWIAEEWDEECRADFVACMAQYSPKEIGFIDETSKDCRSIGWHYGRSQKNKRAQKKQPFVRGQCVSATGLLSLKGITARTVVEGSMMRELFLEFLEFNVMSLL